MIVSFLTIALNAPLPPESAVGQRNRGNPHSELVECCSWGLDSQSNERHRGNVELGRDTGGTVFALKA